VSEVTDLIGRYKAGELTLEELAERFRSRRWPRTAPPLRPSSYLEMAARAQEDPGSDVPDSFDDVEAAFFRHELSAEEYELLRRAVAEAPRAEDQSEP
jgi:predicted RNA polymerase sigma factor